MSSEREAEVAKVLRTALNALALIKNRHDCDYIDVPKAERVLPCPCPRCIADRALKAADGGWRYEGAHPDRLKFNNRERKLLEQWQKFADEHHFTLILDDAPTPRDWYVAATLIQWLGTNVGMCILTEAGFKYTAWDQDRELEAASAASGSSSQWRTLIHHARFVSEAPGIRRSTERDEVTCGSCLRALDADPPVVAPPSDVSK